MEVAGIRGHRSTPNIVNMALSGRTSGRYSPPVIHGRVTCVTMQKAKQVFGRERAFWRALLWAITPLSFHSEGLNNNLLIVCCDKEGI
jgi:hypothetical protein